MQARTENAAIRMNLIGGSWRPSRADDTLNINPSDANDVVGIFARASREDTDEAIEAAAEAFPRWSTISPQTRHDFLQRTGIEILRRKDDLGRQLAREEGKTLLEATSEVVRACQIFTYFAGECLRLAGEKLPSIRPGVEIDITREPIGVVSLITPWNFPIAIPAWKAAPALAYGNCVVLKPADLVPASAHALA